MRDVQSLCYAIRCGCFELLYLWHENGWCSPAKCTQHFCLFMLLLTLYLMRAIFRSYLAIVFIFFVCRLFFCCCSILQLSCGPLFYLAPSILSRRKSLFCYLIRCLSFSLFFPWCSSLLLLLPIIYSLVSHVSSSFNGFDDPMPKSFV